MTYVVKEIYYTPQGEGAYRPCSSFVDSLDASWSGREEDREQAACSFCDTDFIGTDGPGGGRFLTVELLAETIDRHWKNQTVNEVSVPYVVFTGGSCTTR